MQTLFQETFLDILCDEDIPCLHMNWKEYQSDSTIKEGCERLLQLMSEHKIYKILNDNTNALGIWTGVTKWLVFDFRPRAIKAGFICCAHVYGPSRLSQISAEAAQILLGPFTDNIKGFKSIHEAKE
jgi:hypothetical protein